MVARLAHAGNKGSSSAFSIQEDQPYAELWLGTHPKGMSYIVSNLYQLSFEPDDFSSKDLVEDEKKNEETSEHSIPLSSYIKNQDYESYFCNTNGTLGFLLKALSVEKALSIQAHPDKSLAEKLHRQHPMQYDANHKPELAIALSNDFEALCGFCALSTLHMNLRSYPELVSIIGNGIAASIEKMVSGSNTWKGEERVRESILLKQFFQTFVAAPSGTVQFNLKKLLDRLLHKAPLALSETDHLILKLSVQYPNDPGIFTPLFMNHVHLTKDQALYVGPNIPHAYLQGDLMECMATSDNVVRMGLTSKDKDTDLLVNMLDYETSGRPSILFGETNVRSTQYCLLYRPPVPDFMVEVYQLVKGEDCIIARRNCSSLLLLVKGSGTLHQETVSLDGNNGNKVKPRCKSQEASFGRAYYMSPNTDANLIANSEEGIHLVRALTNTDYI